MSQVKEEEKKNLDWVVNSVRDRNRIDRLSCCSIIPLLKSKFVTGLQKTVRVNNDWCAKRRQHWIKKSTCLNTQNFINMCGVLILKCFSQHNFYSDVITLADPLYHSQVWQMYWKNCWERKRKHPYKCTRCTGS